MINIMIERRYGTANRDWLCELTPTGTAWSGARKAIVFSGYCAACRALDAVHCQAAGWPNAPAFCFHLVHQRRHLRVYFESDEIPHCCARCDGRSS